MHVRGLPSNEVAELTGMSLRQLRYLAKVGLVQPSVRPSGGRGEASLYGVGDLRALMIIERVRAVCGQEVRTERLQRVIEAAARGDGRLLVLDEEACWLADGPLEELLRHAQAALVIDLDALDSQLHLRLRRAGISPQPLVAQAA